MDDELLKAGIIALGIFLTMTLLLLIAAGLV